ncbi:TonB-dependent receptor domain-containing protein [Woeseia oceani]|uniref:TonB-dependent receptor n=1 Tax=Woeseia oceani TaxID=1548547 RepID=A0A193LHH5_9GAMM|nr:TonB-dependent receptor [Woeseia oceani]ANO51908.1 TonB-dependent receptor [Woeseia oceani]
MNLRALSLRPLSCMASIALLVSSPAVLAQDDTTDIEQITVVGRMTNVDVTADEIERYQVNDLQDLFRHVPSVSVGGSLGIAQKIYVRGMEDTLLNVTVDGAPQTGTLFHHIGRVKIEPELLKQVSVQSGAGEATAGFGAIGGSIRFLTKDANDLLDDGDNVGGLVRVGVFSNEGQRYSGTVYGRLSDNWGLLGSYVYVNRENMDDGDGNELLATSAEQKLGFLKLSGAIGDKQYLSLSYELRDEEGEFGQRPNWPTLEGDPIYPGSGERETVVANYRFDASDAINVETTLYSTQSDFVQNVTGRWGRYGADIETTGFDVRNTSRLGQHSVTYGIEQRNDEVVSAYLDGPATCAAWAWDANTCSFKEEGTATAAYIQDHFQATDQLLLSFGMRYDDYDFEQLTYDETSGSHGWSGNIGLDYDLTPELTFSIGYAEAMRGKEIGDALTLEKRPGRLRIDPALRPEDVTNAEIGVTYRNDQWFASLVYFQSDIDDVISDQIGGGVAPEDSTYYENIGRYEADGFELGFGYQLDRVRFDLAYSNTTSEINGHTVEGYEYNGIGNARGDTLTVGINFEASGRLELGWNTIAVAGMDDIEVLHRAMDIGWIAELQTIDKPGYAVHDVYARWQPTRSDSWYLSFAVQNVFDKSYRDHSSVGDYSAIPGWETVAGLRETGRDIRLTLSAGF